ncbi:hypothetical protein ACFV98_11955 [Streptomyces violascens]|uniref:hypothetical protein n=1 Tax=Streptomyces violascens TaxID=67381 RepID=UPI00365359EA
MDRLPVVVYPPKGKGRLVTIRGERYGVAYRFSDVVEFLRQAGLDPDDIDLSNPELVEWRGSGMEDWPASGP